MSDVQDFTLFGDIDPEEIPNDPNHVDPGTYECEVTRAQFVTTNDGRHGLSLQYTITDDSDFHGTPIREWKIFYPGITSDELTPEIRKDLSRLKQRLLSLGVPEAAQNSLDPKELLGIRCNVTVYEGTNRNDPTRKYTNVQTVSLLED